MLRRRSDRLVEEAGTVLSGRLFRFGLRLGFRLRCGLRLRLRLGCRGGRGSLGIDLDLDPIRIIVSICVSIVEDEEEDDACGYEHQQNDPDPGRTALGCCLIPPSTLIVAVGILTHCLTSVVVIRFQWYPFGYNGDKHRFTGFGSSVGRPDTTGRRTQTEFKRFDEFGLERRPYRTPSLLLLDREIRTPAPEQSPAAGSR